jgi:DNA-binding transcriptional LysR family regulator
MTFRQLEIFSAIVDTGRFTSAARKLYVAQPSVSQQIQLLEQELGEPLFVRLKNRTIHLTEAGKVLKGHADLILRQCQIAKMEVSTLTTEPSGQIRMGIGGHQLTFMLAPAFRNFHERFSKVCVDIVNGTTPQLLEMLKTNQLDLALLNFPIQSPELQTRLLFTEELCVVIQKTHPIAQHSVADVSEIAQLPLVLFDQSTSTRRRLDAFFQASKITPKVIFELSSVEAMLRMVEEGLGATIVPLSSTLDKAALKKLRVLRIQGKPLTRSVGLAMPPVTRVPRILDVMLDLVEHRFREIGESVEATGRGGSNGSVSRL